jgi:hypothetical protein
MQLHRFVTKIRWFVTPTTVFVGLATLGVLIFLSVAPQLKTPIGGAELSKLRDSQERALGITLEMNKLVISLATLIFGAVAALVLGKEDVRRLDDVQIALALATLLGASSALYFSYLTYEKLVEMLSNNFLELNDDALLLPRQLQIDSLGVAVVMLAGLFLAIVSDRSSLRFRRRRK